MINNFICLYLKHTSLHKHCSAANALLKQSLCFRDRTDTDKCRAPAFGDGTGMTTRLLRVKRRAQVRHMMGITDRDSLGHRSRTKTDMLSSCLRIL